MQLSARVTPRYDLGHPVYSLAIWLQMAYSHPLPEGLGHIFPKWRQTDLVFCLWSEFARRSVVHLKNMDKSGVNAGVNCGVNSGVNTELNT